MANHTSPSGYPFDDRRRPGFCLTNDLSRLSLDTILNWLINEAYWTVGRSREKFLTSFQNSCVYGVLDDDNNTVAFARVVTDAATIAWIGDVFVDEGRRGKGIGTWMVGEITDFWATQGVNRFLLATKDAHGVYAKIGFEPLANPTRFMEIDRRGLM